MRITNIDTLSAYFDRLITERIKWFFFNKDKNAKKAEHQEMIISEIKNKIECLMKECFEKNSYNYISEKRTFNENAITEELDELIINDINIGESDRERLKLVTLNEKRLRKSNEGRAANKNKIDKIFKSFVEGDK
jgi:hypothetical protein|tara:strand:+ start:492 stop:896 length:405 start_codon:yes stop_codon:yes gene_type:complete